MSFRRPLPFREALDSQDARAFLPTDFRTADLEQLDPAVLRAAQFSAQTIDFGRLDNLASMYRSILAGALDPATARKQIQEYIDLHGPGGNTKHDGSLQDFRSEARINLQVDTNVTMMRGLGDHLQGQQPEVLDMWPAKELIRGFNTKVPRDWKQRWLDAGGTLTPDGRMIALKSDLIWYKINRFGRNYAPYDFGSGMVDQDISRREAMSYGIIDRDTRVFPDQTAAMPDRDVAAAHVVQDPRLRAALERTGLGRFDDAGVYRLIAGDDAGGPITNREFARDENGRFAHTAGAIAAGNAAIEKALATKADVMGAMTREDLGPVDFRWGDKRMGIAHILKRSADREAKFKDGLTGPDILRRLPEVIADGTITQRGKNTVTIEHEGYRVILTNSWNHKPSDHWLLSGYDVSDKKKGNR